MSAKKPRGLTAKQERFCAEYLMDLNATQAAIRAGYSPRTAAQAAHKLGEKSSVSERIQELQADRSQRTQVTADRVIERLEALYERAMATEPVLDKEGKPTGLLVYDAATALKVLELEGKHLGMWNGEGRGDEAGQPLLQINVAGMPWLTPARQKELGLPPIVVEEPGRDH